MQSEYGKAVQWKKLENVTEEKHKLKHANSKEHSLEKQSIKITLHLLLIIFFHL